jgi:hypothetical protein
MGTSCHFVDEDEWSYLRAFLPFFARIELKGTYSTVKTYTFVIGK